MSESKDVAYIEDRRKLNPALERQPSIAGETTISKVEVDSKVMKARENQYYAVIHISYNGGHLNYASPRVESVVKAEGIAASARDLFVEVLQTILHPPE